MMKYDLFWWSILQGKNSCARRMLISLSSKWTLTTELLNWLTKLQCIHASNCTFSRTFTVFPGRSTSLRWSRYRDVCSPSVSVIFPCRLTGNEPLSILPLNSLPEQNVGRAHYKLCDRLKLEKKQRRMCRRDPGVAETLREAITMSALECQYQFRFERWNCTLEGRHRANILKRGTRFVVFSRFLGKTGNGSWPHTLNVLFQDLKKRPSCMPSPQRDWLTRWPRLAAQDEWNAAPAMRLQTWRTGRHGSGEAAETTSNTPTSLLRTSWANAPTKTCAHVWTCTTRMWAWRLVCWFWGWSLLFLGGAAAPVEFYVTRLIF